MRPKQSVTPSEWFERKLAAFKGREAVGEKSEGGLQSQVPSRAAEGEGDSRFWSRRGIDVHTRALRPRRQDRL